jgi:ABC-type phosphate transport system substrate-binding protein
LAALALTVVVGSVVSWMAGPAVAQGRSQFQVIVNVANPVETLGTEVVSRLFLKKVTSWDEAGWDEGGRVVPVDRSSDSRVREQFSRGVHKRSVAAVKSYWQQMIFSGRDVPPPEKSTAEEVLEIVESSPGAIGYIESSVGLPAGVKRVKVSD